MNCLAYSEEASSFPLFQLSPKTQLIYLVKERLVDKTRPRCCLVSHQHLGLTSMYATVHR